jgi:hypothetical protein
MKGFPRSKKGSVRIADNPTGARIERPSGYLNAEALIFRQHLEDVSSNRLKPRSTAIFPLPLTCDTFAASASAYYLPNRRSDEDVHGSSGS